MAAIGIDDHCHGVPANEALDAHFHGPIAREWRLSFDRNRVDVRCADDARGGHARVAEALGHVAEELRRTFRAAFFQRHFQQRLQRLQHFVAIAVILRLQYVDVGAASARLRMFFFFFLRFHFKSINNAVIIGVEIPKRASKPARGPKCQTNVAQIAC